MEKTAKKAAKTPTPKKDTKKVAPKAKPKAAPKKAVKKTVAKPAVKKTPVKKVEAVKAVVKKEPSKVEKKVEVVKAVVKTEPVKAEKKVEKRVVKKSSAGAPIAHGVGRRKCAVARVWIRPGRGSMKVNELDYAEYFDTDLTRLRATHPFYVINDAKRYDVTVTVEGGGGTGQSQAVSLGLARALLNINSSWRSSLRKAGLLTVDARTKERKKYGQRGARRKFQFVKR